MSTRPAASRWCTGLAGALWICAAGACTETAPRVTAKLWPEADGLFHRDPRWLGADGAYSVDLGGERVLWLFGDTFIAETDARVRSESVMVRNSVAIQQGLNPAKAFWQPFWSEVDGRPQSFFPEDQDAWFWPGHGVRLDDVLLLFFERVRTPPDDPEGFEGAGWTAAVVANPDDEPLDWTLSRAQLPADGSGRQLGEAAVRWGDQLYLYATEGDWHEVQVGRIAVEQARQGDLRSVAWWDGETWTAAGSPAPVVALGSPELSVHRDARLGKWVMVDSQGYGPTTIALRVADAPEGPWSAPRDVIRPPESFTAGSFSYAAKAHPELCGADLVITYVPSTFDPPPQEVESSYYFPRFVRAYYP